MKKDYFFSLLFSFSFLSMLAQPCSQDSVRIIDLKNLDMYSSPFFSPLEKGKIWFVTSGEYRQYYEIDVKSQSIISLSQKFNTKKRLSFQYSYLVDSLDHAFWFITDSLYRYDLLNHSLMGLLYTPTYRNNWLLTKERLFFKHDNSLYVYEKENKKFKTIYEKAPFFIEGLVKDAKSGNIYLNSNTYFDEETYDIRYCTDDKIDFSRLKYQSIIKQNVTKNYHQNESNYYWNYRQHFDDEQGCWTSDEGHIFYRPHDTKQMYILKKANLVNFHTNNKLMNDDCNFYIKGKNSFYIISKQYLIAQMKPFNQILFDKYSLIFSLC